MRFTKIPFSVLITGLAGCREWDKRKVGRADPTDLKRDTLAQCESHMGICKNALYSAIAMFL